MNRMMLAAIAIVTVALAQNAAANPDRADRTFTGSRDWLTSSGFEINGRPAQQITLETRLLVSDSAAIEALGVSPVINGVTLFVPLPDGATGIYQTRTDATAGYIYIDSLFGQPTAPTNATATPVGLGFLYGDQILIDVRMGETMSYDPTAIDASASLSEEFRSAMADISEAGFGLPRVSGPRMPTQVLISDGKSLLMGFEPGFREYREKAEIPLLSDIPMLGPLFIGRVSETDRRALVIHITPRIVDETE
jgi:hypothetical protein